MNDMDPVTDMNPEEQAAFLDSVKAELARRGEPVPGGQKHMTPFDIIMRRRSGG